MDKLRRHYDELFLSYPDVVTIAQFCEMLGGIGDSTARKLLRDNRVHHFYIRTTYQIPKVFVIDYVMSDHYKEYNRFFWDGYSVLTDYRSSQDSWWK